jgi:hypothetical protein
LARLLAEDDDAEDPNQGGAVHDQEEEAVEKPISLNEHRLTAVIDHVTYPAYFAHTVLWSRSYSCEFRYGSP